MLRVGLTGGLGSGKSTAARMFAALGAHVLSSDEIGRAMMQPGEAVFAAIVKQFGSEVVRDLDGTLDRAVLAKIAFAGGRVEELNAIVHPAVIYRQNELAEQIGAATPDAVVMVESALIFETRHGETSAGGWRTRFDKLILVTAPEDLRVRRFVERSATTRRLSEEGRVALEAEAYGRMAQQMADEQKALRSDYVITNGGSIRELEWQIDQLWPLLLADAETRLS